MRKTGGSPAHSPWPHGNLSMTTRIQGHSSPGRCSVHKGGPERRQKSSVCHTSRKLTGTPHCGDVLMTTAWWPSCMSDPRNKWLGNYQRWPFRHFISSDPFWSPFPTVVLWLLFFCLKWIPKLRDLQLLHNLDQPLWAALLGSGWGSTPVLYIHC